MSKYAIFLELSNRRAVVIGGGSVAVRKAQTLLEADARLVVVAENIDEMMTALCKNKNAELIRSKYEKSYITGAVLAIAATNDHELNKQIYKDCQELEILCNVVDEPDLCDFFVPALVKRGDLQIAVSTDGKCPAFAGHIRKKLEDIFTEKHGEFLRELEKMRLKILQQISEENKRKIILGKLTDDSSFDYFVRNGSEKWQIYADELIK
jgi:precorrin-2 dehydrogenase/sirohydrochlorin ferrochelatase